MSLALLLAATSPPPAAVRAAGEPDHPSFDCRRVRPGSIPDQVCGDPQLAALDRRLDHVYRLARQQATRPSAAMLRAEQRGWIKGRDDCWKADDRRACVARSYRLRTAELQARYRLLPARGPFEFVCEGQPANTVTVSYFDTEPGSAIAERGDRSAVLFQRRSGSGTRYAGRNIEFREHQGTATLTWGPDAEPLHCVLAPRRRSVP